MKRTKGLALVFLACAASVLALEGTAAGVKWMIPPAWKLEAGRPMRVATYSIPAMASAEAGECGVFFFGGGQGGGVEENINRWVKQFEGGAAPKRSEKIVGGFSVHLVDVAGTYLAPGGPMMQSQGKKSGYRLLGAIVEAPHGMVFFKCTGPASTLAKAQADFDRLIGSLSKSGATAL